MTLLGTSYNGGELRDAVNVSAAAVLGDFYDDHFADDGATIPTYSATQPSAIYMPEVGKTVAAWEVLSLEARKRAIKVSAFNHATRLWEGPYLTKVDSALYDDDHGVPSLCVDYQGYIWAFGGAHYGPAMYCSVSAAPFDPSSWNVGVSITRDATPADNAYCYPFPFAFGQSLGVIMRRDDSTVFAGNTHGMDLVWRKSASLTGGVVTWAADDVELVNLQADTRVYHAGALQAKNGEIYIAATRANLADTLRQDVYVFILNPFTGAVRSIRSGGSVVPQGSLPIVRAFADSNFKEVDQAGAGTYGSVPVTAFDPAGNFHLVYMSSAVNDPTGAFDLMHMYHNGTSWSSAVKIGVTTNRYTQLALKARADGSLALFWSVRASGQPSTWRTGNLQVAVRSAAGVWAPPTLIRAAGAFLVDSPAVVKNGRPELEIIYGEQTNVGTTSGGSGGAGGSDAHGGVLRLYGLGQSGAAVQRAYRYTGPAMAWADRLTTAPTNARLRSVDRLISRLIDANIWNDFDGFYLLASSDAATACVNLKSSRFTLTPNGGLTFTANSGYQGDGSTGYLDTGFNPSLCIDGCRWSQNSAHMSLWNLTEGQSANAEMGFPLAAGYQTLDSTLTIRNASDGTSARLNAGGSSTVTPSSPSALGHFMARRTASAVTDIYRDGERLLQDTSTASNGVVNANLCILRSHTSYSSRKLAFASFGGGMADASTSRAKAAILRNAVYRYLWDVGAVAAE